MNVKVGDIVILNGGSYFMTVENIKNPGAPGDNPETLIQTVWMKADGSLESGLFAASCLMVLRKLVYYE